MLEIILSISGFIALLISGFLFWQSRSLKIDLAKREAETNRRMYELAILKELGERVGYSLNVQKIIDIITGSLHQFLEYSAVSYMLLEPEKIIFKVDLEKSVSREFITEIRSRMLSSLSALLNKEYKKEQVEEMLTGAILVDELSEPVRSFFNIPLIIADKVVGVLTVAHTEAGLYKEEEMTILYKITQQASEAVTRLQEVVATEQGKLNDMVESMTDGVVMTDMDYRVMVVNPAAKQVVGIAKDQAEVNIFDFIDNLEGHFDIRGKLEEAVKLNKVLTNKDVLIKERFYQILVSPVKSSRSLTQDKILGGVVIFHDITQEKAVARLREDFTSMIVHELRSPLDGINKISELLVRGKIDTQTKEYLDYTKLIQHSSSEMLELVNDLLDVAKLEAGKFEINKETGSIKQVIDNRVNFYKTLAQDAKVTLGTKLAADLPDLSFDSKRIVQVLNNLISNALKFTKIGGSVIVQALIHRKDQDLKTEASQADIKWHIMDTEGKLAALPDSLILGITDTGIGISDSTKRQLFNKFKQFRSSAVSDPEIKGTGLGLVIAKGIVEAHQGVIGVDSQEGVGSTFYFSLPLT